MQGASKREEKRKEKKEIKKEKVLVEKVKLKEKKVEPPPPQDPSEARRARRQAMEERGRVWDRNQLPSGIQSMFLQTATYYVGADWRALQVRHHLLLVLGNQKT